MGKRMRSILKQVVSCLLVLTMLVNLPLGHLPNVFADEVSNQEILAPVIPEEDEVSDETQLIEPEGDYVSWEESANALTGEINERREQNIKHFMREDGSIEAVTYPYSVHYENEDEWVDIDNTLVFDEINKTYRTNSNSFQTSFSSDVLSDELVNMTNGGTELSWVIPEMSEAEVEIENPGESTDMRYNNKLFSKVTYKDAINGIDVQYVIGPDGVQEYFVVENEEELETLEDITIVMKTNNLEASENRDIVRFRDGTGRTKFTLGQPVMFDGNGENVKEIPFELKAIEQAEIVVEDVVQETIEPAITSEPVLDKNEVILQETVSPEITDINTDDSNSNVQEISPTESTEGDEVSLEEETVIEISEYEDAELSATEEVVDVIETEEIIDGSLELEESAEATGVPVETEVVAKNAEITTTIPEMNAAEPVVEEVIQNESISKTEEYIAEISKIIDKANSNEENYYTYTLNLVEELPDAEDITFPLIIDPDITSDTKKENIDDSYISSSTTTTNYGLLERLKIGRGSDSGITRSFIKINTLPEITSGDMVVSASLVMPRYMDKKTIQSHVGYDAQLNLHNVTSPWTETEITWKNVPTFDSTIASVDFSEYFDISTGRVSVNVFDITKIAKGWYQNTIPNYGVMVKNMDETTSGAYHEFGSGEMLNYPTHHPVLSVVYVNAAGLEDSYSYHEQAIGRAGTSYVNDATGHMTLVHSDVTTTDSMMPASLFHTYNTSLYDVQSGYGKGFRISYDQTITAKAINNKSYYEYIDEDGTKHYFYQDSSNTNLYYDERNKNNKLTISGTTATLVYGESHITKIFESNKLKYIRDANGNQIEIRRNASTRVENIIDPSGNKITLYYNSNNWLDKIVAPGNLTTYLTYDTNGYLIKIKYPDSKTSTYTYNSKGYMSLAKNYDGYGMNFSYSGNPSKVTQVSESVGTEWYMYLMFKYGHLVTTVTDLYGRTSHYRFNNFGQLISEQDKDGNAVYYDYASSTPGKKDQLNVSSDIQKTSINLLGNGNFVSDIGWWSVYNSVADAATISHTGTKNISLNGMYIYKTNSSASSYVYATTTVDVNETYDFSAYIRYGGTADIYIYVEYRDAAGQKYVTKKPIIANNNEWTKNYISVEIPSTATGTIYTGILMPSGTSGGVVVDDAQLTKGGGGEKTTLIKNGDFKNGTTGWSTAGCSSSDVVTSIADTANYKPSNLDDKTFKMAGDINAVKFLYQNVSIRGTTGDTYVAGAFVKAESIPYFQNKKSSETGTTNYGQIVLRTEFFNNGTLVNQVDKEFLNDTYDWQYLSMAATAKGTYTTVRVNIIYVRNQNQMYVDGISLYKDGFGLNYTYNQDDNDLTKVETKEGETYQYTYDESHNPDIVTDKYGRETDYDYDENNNLDFVTYYDGKTTEYDYDSRGNLIGTRNYDSSAYYFFGTTSGYATTKNLKTSDTDIRGNSINYSYTDDGRLKSVEDVKNTLNYNYLWDKLSAVSDDDTKVQYNYSGDNLNAITLYGNNEERFKYYFTYNDFNQLQSTMVESKSLVTNTYDSYKKYLKKSTYGNGYVRNYVYDDRDILVAENDGSKELYRNYYSSNGRLYQKRDNLTESTLHYDYDEKERITRVIEIDDDGNQASVLYNYNNVDLVSETQRTHMGTKWTETHTYTNEDYLDYSVSSNGSKADYSYDDLGRVTGKTLTDTGTGSSIAHTNYAYLDVVDDGEENKVGTTGLISLFSYSVGGSTKDRILYTYDETGLITREKGLNSDIKYTYDSKSQLTHVYNETENDLMIYEYDEGGNITEKINQFYDGGASYTKDTIIYEYDSTWNDLLVSYDGKTIEYDAIGNPTKYLDFSNLTWEGRNLTKVYKDGALQVKYAYNSDGLRVSKEDKDWTIEYIYLDGKLSAITYDGGAKMSFSYDGNGDIISVRFLNKNYYYVKNIQGDVIALINESGEIVEEYTYDAWGKPTSTPTTTVGKYNPFRYRGYIYDEETGFYYLGSRYYDPEVGRFINADILFDEGAGILAYNLFTYCANNPINFYDYAGAFVVSTLLVCVIGGIIIGGTAGGIVGNYYANSKGITGWEKTKIILTGIGIGGTIGGITGYFAAPAIVSATGVAGVSVSASGISTIASIGTSFGKLGTLIANNRQQIIDWGKTTFHAINRMEERGVTQGMVELWVKTGKALQQLGDKTLYVTKQGAVVVDKLGKVITAYTSEFFDANMQEIIEKLFGK